MHLTERLYSNRTTTKISYRIQTMVASQRRLVETSETAEEKIRFIKNAIRKNVIISAIIGSVLLLLLLIFCYIRYKNGRYVEVMSRRTFEKKKTEFKRVLEPEETEERNYAALGRRIERKRDGGGEYASPGGDHSMETHKTLISSFDAEEGGGGGIEVSPFHSMSGNNIESPQRSSIQRKEHCKVRIQSPQQLSNKEYGGIEVEFEGIEV